VKKQLMAVQVLLFEICSRVNNKMYRQGLDISTEFCGLHYVRPQKTKSLSRKLGCHKKQQVNINLNIEIPNFSGVQMKFQKCAIAAFISLSLLGCASVGNETLRVESEASVQKKMVEGKTTKSEVRAMFGSPLKTSFTDGGLEIWTYEFSKVSADAVSYIPIVNLFGATASGTKKELVVLIDKAGIVQRFSMSESDVKQKTGVFNN
jgi:outer membrane protein assembly factor BamE (lipoprotein component of BamABCDE complex)